MIVSLVKWLAAGAAIGAVGGAALGFALVVGVGEILKWIALAFGFALIAYAFWAVRDELS